MDASVIQFQLSDTREMYWGAGAVGMGQGRILVKLFLAKEITWMCLLEQTAHLVPTREDIFEGERLLDASGNSGSRDLEQVHQPAHWTGTKTTSNRGLQETDCDSGKNWRTRRHTPMHVHYNNPVMSEQESHFQEHFNGQLTPEFLLG